MTYRKRKSLVSLVLLVTMLLIGSSAMAAPVTWTLDNVTLDDGGTATGSFVFDFDICHAGGATSCAGNGFVPSFLSWNIELSGGMFLGGTTFVYSDAGTPGIGGGFSTSDVAPGRTNIRFQDNTGGRFFDLNMVSELTNAGGAIAVFTPQVAGEFSFSPNPFINRFVIGGSVIGVPNAEAFTCIGFEPPLDVSPVTVRGKNRALPLKAQLLDMDSFPVTDLDVVSPPVVQVLFTSATGGMSEDVTGDVLSAGQGDEGNQFVFSDNQWQFNLKTKNYQAPGTYAISMFSGDETEYRIDNPTCEVDFEVAE